MIDHRFCSGPSFALGDHDSELHADLVHCHVLMVNAMKILHIRETNSAYTGGIEHRPSDQVTALMQSSTGLTNDDLITLTDSQAMHSALGQCRSVCTSD